MTQSNKAQKMKSPHTTARGDTSLKKRLMQFLRYRAACYGDKVAAAELDMRDAGRKGGEE